MNESVASGFSRKRANPDTVLHTVALTREVPDSLQECELTHLGRAPIDLGAARAQHAEYERALTSLGCRVVRISAAHELPDSAFVEDTAVVLDELAVITRPGAASRRDETAGVASVLEAYRPLSFLSAPATLDGGDVLRLGRTLYVGVGARTNEEGARQLDSCVRPYGYDVRRVDIAACLHLKSAVAAVAPGMVLLNPAWVDARTFERCRAIEVDAEEPFASNVLRIGDALLCAAAYPRTNARLESVGLSLRPLNVSELAKAEAGLTCSSLIVPVAATTATSGEGV